MTKSDCQYIRGLVRTRQNVPGSFQQRAVDNHIASCHACREFFQDHPEYILAAQLGISMPLLDVVTLKSQKVGRRRASMKGVRRISNEQRVTLVKQAKPVRRAKAAKNNVGQKPKIQQPKSTAHRYTPILQSVYYMGIGVVIAFVLYYAIQTGARFNSLARIYNNLGIISVATTPVVDRAPDVVPAATVQPTLPVEPDINAIGLGENRTLTVLLLGTDRRPQESSPARSDSIMVMRIMPDTGGISLLSLPRDLMVNIPGYGIARVNAATVYGDLYQSLGSGMTLATQTVSNVIGVPIDYTVVIDFQGFISAIDALGGVTVSVPKALYDAKFPTMEYGIKEVSFAPGPTVMDGYTALVYSRIRHPDNDFERMTRQQEVLKGIMRQLQQGGFLAQVDSTANITDALVRHARTDAPRDVIITLAWHMRNTPVDSVRSVVFRDVYYGSGADQYAMFPVDGALERSVAEWMQSP